MGDPNPGGFDSWEKMPNKSRDTLKEKFAVREADFFAVYSLFNAAFWGSIMGRFPK